jgi:hypothetical protein
MVSGYEKSPDYGDPDPKPWDWRTWLVALAFWGFIALVAWRLTFGRS